MRIKSKIWPLRNLAEVFFFQIPLLPGEGGRLSPWPLVTSELKAAYPPSQLAGLEPGDRHQLTYVLEGLQGLDWVWGICGTGVTCEVGK